jgi:DNA-binding transcriptional ArsR family regulator
MKNDQRRNANRGKGEQSSVRRFGARQRRDDDLVRALDHRLRREIMRLLHASEVPLSTSEIAVSIDEKLGRTSHHIEVLRRRGLVVLVGVAEHGEGLYASRIKEQAVVTIFLEQADKTNSMI